MTWHGDENMYYHNQCGLLGGGTGFYFVCISLCLRLRNVTKDIWSLPSYNTSSPWLWPLTSAWWSQAQLVHAVSSLLLAELHLLGWQGGNTVSHSSPRSQGSVPVQSVMNKPAYHSSPFFSLFLSLDTIRILEQEKSSRQSSSLLAGQFFKWLNNFCFLQCRR